jgi:dienelactone hydrolase
MTMRPDDYAAIGGASAPAFTRDGRRLLFLGGAGLPQICELALDTGVTRQLTWHDEKVALLRRCPVDDRVIYGIDRGGDECQQLWLLDANDPVPTPRPLTDNPAAIHDWGGWAPDGTRFTYAANDRDVAAFDVYVQDVMTGERRCVFQADGIVSVSGFRPDGAMLVLLHDRGYGEMSLLLLDLASGEATAFPQPRGCNYQSVRWASDGRSLLALTDHGDSDFLRLCRLDPDNGAVSVVFEAAGRDVDAWGIAPDGGTLVTLENDRGYTVLRAGAVGASNANDAAGAGGEGAGEGEGAREAEGAGEEAGAGDSPSPCGRGLGGGAAACVPPTNPSPQPPPSRGGGVFCSPPSERASDVAVRDAVGGLPCGVIAELTFSPDGTCLAFTVSTATLPTSIWLWRDGVAQPVWQPEPSVDPASFVDLELVEWHSFDDMRIQGWLALPPGAPPPGGHPAVVWVHGGPVAQSRAGFRPDMQMLLACGFAVLMPNVRGSSGYGRAFAAADDVEKRLDSVADLTAGRNFLAAHPAIDPQRIGIMGQSYGGFMVLSAITEYPELWRAAVDYYGIADFVTTLAGTGPWRRSHRAAEYGDLPRDAALFARISPIHRIDRVEVPLLVAHGTRDPRVPLGESEQVVAALRERQHPVTYLEFDYAGHGFIRPDDRRRIFTAVADFFRTHL